MNVASGVRNSIVLYIQKRVVDVELDRTVAFYWRYLVLFVKALPDESPQPVPAGRNLLDRLFSCNTLSRTASANRCNASFVPETLVYSS